MVKKYSYPLQFSKFRKNDKYRALGVKYFGDKAYDDEMLHSKFIGKNMDICRNLLGLGKLLLEHNVDLGLGEYANHIWLPQKNLADGERIDVCMHCGSIMDNGNFVPVTAIEAQAELDELNKK